MANRALSIVISIVLVLVVLRIALWLFGIVLNLFFNIVLAILVVAGIFFIIRAVSRR
ncbi:hypothetical protein ACHABQ_10025 [Nesterenkonia aurantiaca]|uniref:hypothetical protein n=1 Tax=Nesterenkonia aurantiaca TaxID=1436010 RepID=UPI003EE7503B